ncbi:MAG: hypothetical protein LBB84_06690, partial [Tannerellaceae bacterium]|nr:hypothetical protein [Tannerellaceae bacterium]
QKCGDYELSHKYSRNSYLALQNYYALLQIAHAINQFVEKDKAVSQLLNRRPKETFRNLWSKLKAFMIFVPLPTDAFLSLPQNDTKPAPG